MGLTVAGDYIYWTDWTTKARHRADRTTGQNSHIIKGKLQALRDIHAIQLHLYSGGLHYSITCDEKILSRLPKLPTHHRFHCIDILCMYRFAVTSLRVV